MLAGPGPRRESVCVTTPTAKLEGAAGVDEHADSSDAASAVTAVAASARRVRRVTTRRVDT